MSQATQKKKQLPLPLQKIDSNNTFSACMQAVHMCMLQLLYGVFVLRPSQLGQPHLVMNKEQQQAFVCSLGNSVGCIDA